MILPNEYIQLESLLELCHTVFDGKTPPTEDLVFVQPERIKEFFQICRRKPYVIVSCASDAGLVYQADAPVNADIMWYADGLKLIADLPPTEKYQGLHIVPRCYPYRCNHTDKYSIKYMQLTHSTFSEIPDNIVKWYSCNLRISDERLVCIPFGISKNIGSLHYKKEKSKLLYVNFQEFSHGDRVKLREYYKKQSWVTYVDQALPFNEYAEQLAEHKFVLSPYGNGLDCYRTWESIYSGSVPIVQRSKWSDHFNDLPILSLNNLFDIKPDQLEHLWQLHTERNFVNFEKATLSYWKKRILDDTDRIKKPACSLQENARTEWLQTMQAFHQLPSNRSETTT